MRIVIATIVHHPKDARIRFRQIEFLIDAGHEITYIAPRTTEPLSGPGLDHIPVRRAQGRRRLGPLLDARRELRAHSPDADLVVIHDPELIVLHRSIRSPKVWDVHEDLVAQVSDKPWIPRPLRWLARIVAATLERKGQSRFACTIAETGYRSRFPDATVVRNTARVPEKVRPAGRTRVSYLGRVSYQRGAKALADLAPRLPEGVQLEVLGPLDSSIDPKLLQHERLHVHGFVPNRTALHNIEGSLAGLALLHDEPNYRVSLPTKVLEYMAHGIPVITTPLPEAQAIVEAYDCGIVVPFDDPAAVAAAIQRLHADQATRERFAANGRRAAADHFNWEEDAAAMLELYETVARS